TPLDSALGISHRRGILRARNGLRTLQPARQSLIVERPTGGRTMQLGFVSAILPDLSLDEVLAFAADEGFGCVELMCWPPGGADRRYAGVMHLDVTNFTDDHAGRVRDLVKKHGVVI